MSESSETAWMDNPNARRWLVSAAIVLLLHAAVAVAVLTWREVRSTAPILIDLSPGSRQTASAPPVADQNASQPAGSEQNKTEAASAADHTAPSAATAGNSSGEATSTPPMQESPGAGSAEASGGMTGPQLPSSPQGTEAEGGTLSGGVLHAPSASGSGAGAVAASPGAGGPLPPPLAPMGRIAANPTTGPAVTKPTIPGSVPGSTVPGPTISGPTISGRTISGRTIPGPVASAPPSGIAPSGPMTSPMARMPLDTSITVQPPVHGNSGVGPFARGPIGPLASRETGPNEHQPSIIFRPAKPYGVPDVPRNSLLPNGNPSLPGLGLKIAPGAHVQDRARAAMARAANRTEPVKNAIGSTVPSRTVPGAVLGTTMPVGQTNNATTTLASRGSATEMDTGNGVVRNAIGVTANFRPRLPRAYAGEANRTGAGAVAAAGHGMPTAPIINGHDLARPVAGPGVIGGPARGARTGVLSGSDFHLRHP